MRSAARKPNSRSSDSLCCCGASPASSVSMHGYAWLDNINYLVHIAIPISYMHILWLYSRVKSVFPFFLFPFSFSLFFSCLSLHRRFFWPIHTNKRPCVDVRHVTHTSSTYLAMSGARRCS
ncbi:hypothetical protein ACQKWADRAFT_207672 [Trichoderma austrokoningii]